jgi:hypothetical protein
MRPTETNILNYLQYSPRPARIDPPTMKAPFFPIQQFRVRPLVLTAAALSFAVAAYAQQDTQQVEARVNEILSQMTLDEKINYISGAIVNFASLAVLNLFPSQLSVLESKPVPEQNAD